MHEHLGVCMCEFFVLEGHVRHAHVGSNVYKRVVCVLVYRPNCACLCGACVEATCVHVYVCAHVCGTRATVYK